MSYEIVKNIKIDLKNQKVFITGASSNLYPHRFETWEATRLSKMLAKQGLEAVEKEILLQYENGEFQKSNNVYQLAADYVQTLPEYKTKYSWRLLDTRNEDKLKDFLYKIYKSSKACKPSVIEFSYENDNVFIKKLKKEHIAYAYSLSKAKVYTNKYKLAIDLNRLEYKQPTIVFTPKELEATA